MQTLYPVELEAPPPADRLRAMINALACGAEIDAAMRAEIIDALKRHEVHLANDKLRSSRGHGIEFPVWFAAALANKLIENHGAKPKKAAIYAAAESVKWQQGMEDQQITQGEIAAITRAYQKLCKAPGGRITTTKGAFQIAFISQAWIEDAAARYNREKPTASRVEAIGAIALLTDPI